MKLAILVTGQLRSFFDNDVLSSFQRLLSLSSSHYGSTDNIFLLFVVSGDFQSLESYFKTTSYNYKIIPYSTPEYSYQFSQICHSIHANPQFQTNKSAYLSIPSFAHTEISDPEWYVNVGTMQFHQLQIGIQYLKQHHIAFDTILKTRFDIIYPHDFIPAFPTQEDSLDPIRRLTLTDSNYSKFMNTFTMFGFRNLGEYISHMKTQSIQPPYYHVLPIYSDIAFGGPYFYNHPSITKILQNPSTDNILYSFGDFFFLSQRDVFFRLENYINNYGCIPYSIPHFFAQEAQSVIFCLDNDIDIVMFTNDTYKVKRQEKNLNT